MSERARSMGLSGTFHERKAHRKAYNEKYVYGWKERPCGACNGSGHYDHNGSPPCGSCEGTGKEKFKPEREVRHDPDEFKKRLQTIDEMQTFTDNANHNQELIADCYRDERKK
jgi:DnaJ-class molecular chaperone